jgi:hypothetical protein
MVLAFVLWLTRCIPLCDEEISTVLAEADSKADSTFAAEVLQERQGGGPQ